MDNTEDDEEEEPNGDDEVDEATTNVRTEHSIRMEALETDFDRMHQDGIVDLSSNVDPRTAARSVLEAMILKPSKSKQSSVSSTWSTPSPTKTASSPIRSSTITTKSTSGGRSLEDRFVTLFRKATTPECRAKIAKHYGYFVNALAREEAFPFAPGGGGVAESLQFRNECPLPMYADWDDLPEGMHVGHVQNITYRPPRRTDDTNTNTTSTNGTNTSAVETAEYIDDPANLRLCFGILTHEDDTHATERLIEALYEDGHVFVIHVDGKESSDDTYQRLVRYAATRKRYVHVLPQYRRVRVNWGGFSMVNATLQILQYAFAVDHDNGHDDDANNNRQGELPAPLQFHKFVHVASTSYPIASNREIRQRLSEYPLDANFMNIIMKPSRPNPSSWFYFVECDDALHRIHRLPPLLNATHGAELYTSSQWFISSREFAQYLAEARPGTFVQAFLDYIEHVVVADETFFGTVLLHTPYCTKLHNSNFLHLQFDRWESELPAPKRDERKCMMKDPDHCGRSPTTMTIDYADILELNTDNLFARKFVDSTDSRVKDIVDEWRTKRQANATLDGDHGGRGVDFEGHGVLIVAKDTVHDLDTAADGDGENHNVGPLCLGLGQTGNKPKLVPCFHEEVIPTLAHNWAEGGVVLEETIPNNRWTVGPCTTDGHVERLPSAEMNVTEGRYSISGPRCMIKQMDGLREGRCLDTDSDGLQPGGMMHVFPCVNRWFQFVSFGRHDGVAPHGSIFSTIPSHVVKQIHNLGHADQTSYMCLGVWGRGKHDEEYWDAEEEEGEESEHANEEKGDYTDSEFEPLSHWVDHEVITTRCTNVGGVIEWLFVPFILEEEGNGPEIVLDTDKNATSTSATSQEDNTTAKPVHANQSAGTDPMNASCSKVGDKGCLDEL